MAEKSHEDSSQQHTHRLQNSRGNVKLKQSAHCCSCIDGFWFRQSSYICLLHPAQSLGRMRRLVSQWDIVDLWRIRAQSFRRTIVNQLMRMRAMFLTVNWQDNDDEANAIVDDNDASLPWSETVMPSGGCLQAHWQPSRPLLSTSARYWETFDCSLEVKILWPGCTLRKGVDGATAGSW